MEAVVGTGVVDVAGDCGGHGDGGDGGPAIFVVLLVV